MGVCASHHSTEKKTTRAIRKKNGVGVGARAWSESFRRPPWIMVMDISSGAIKEYRQPIRASLVVSENNPSCYLSNAESMSIGTCMPRVPDDEELLPGRIYFLVPLSYSHYPLSLSLLCDLAVKTSSALNVPVFLIAKKPKGGGKWHLQSFHGMSSIAIQWSPTDYGTYLGPCPHHLCFCFAN